MPVKGPQPKPEGQARNRNKPAHQWVEVTDAPFASAPKLPDRTPEGETWPTWTRRWWRSVSVMPHCRLWTATDWEFAYDTAALKAQFHRGGSVALAAEIRNRERVLGTTDDFRRGLRIRYVSPTQAPDDGAPAGVTLLDDYRDL